MCVNVIWFLSMNYLKPLFEEPCPKENAFCISICTWICFFEWERERGVKLKLAHWEVLIIMPSPQALNLIIHVCPDGRWARNCCLNPAIVLQPWTWGWGESQSQMISQPLHVGPKSEPSFPLRCCLFGWSWFPDFRGLFSTPRSLWHALWNVCVRRCLKCFNQPNTPPMKRRWFEYLVSKPNL